MSLPLGAHITFQTVDGSIDDVRVVRGEVPPTLTDGFGGWTVVNRPKKVGAVIWEGKPPLGMKVPILFDGWHDHDPQEKEISRLIRMSWPPKEHEGPPDVKVSGGTPGDTFTWRINDIEWGDNQIWDFYRGSMVRYRQDAVVTLIQAVDIDLVLPESKKKKVRYYVVKHGDTLQTIAVKFYHNRSKWKVIAKANNIRDPRSVKVGRRLKIP